MASLDNLTVTVGDDDPPIVVADGQIDSHTSPFLDDALAAMAPGARVSIDLSRVTFVDSSGLRVIVRAHKRQREGGGSLVLVAPSQTVVKLLDITGLTAELDIAG